VSIAEYWKDGSDVTATLPRQLTITAGLTSLTIAISGPPTSLIGLFAQVKGSYAVKLNF
jgi:hypothetical protein